MKSKKLAVKILRAPAVERDEEPRFVHPFDGCPQAVIRALDEDEVVERASRRYIRPEEIPAFDGDPVEAAILSEELALAEKREQQLVSALQGLAEIDYGVQALKFADSVDDLAVERNAKPADVAIEAHFADARREQQLAAHEAMIAARAMRRAGAMRISPQDGLKRPIWSLRGIAFA